MSPSRVRSQPPPRSAHGSWMTHVHPEVLHVSWRLCREWRDPSVSRQGASCWRRPPPGSVRQRLIADARKTPRQHDCVMLSAPGSLTLDIRRYARRLRRWPRGSRACGNGDYARSRRQWRVQGYRIGPHWCERPPRFADTAAVSRIVADPDRHDVPAMELAAGDWGLVNDNSVQQRLTGVGVWPGEQESAIMAEQPGIQGLHAAEVRNLDEFRMPRLRMHKATPQGQDTTVPAGPQTIALLQYPGRRCQAQGRPLAASAAAATSRGLRRIGMATRRIPGDAISITAYQVDLDAYRPLRPLVILRTESAIYTPSFQEAVASGYLRRRPYSVSAQAWLLA